jgi:hypothetical protein
MRLRQHFAPDPDPDRDPDPDPDFDFDFDFDSDSEALTSGSAALNRLAGPASGTL